MSRGKKLGGVLLLLVLLLLLIPARAWAIEVGGVAPNFKAYEEVVEEDIEFYAYVKNGVALLWIWDWSMGCPI